ncbi:penicillin-binding transpeptidase domain-containing protein [Candidatus Ishikawella capsulata]|uniref:Transpeptidase n=1 Tax=Candidatus Ishikawaella capsulata Mpkobe TaxID=476281 RepID=C5WD48_9ENTR|nr:penicillin-binding transpeptidase domain-containing protein [Candidatus Ishikawaella capsulata]BAH83254.1 transpeptidase [Candidatus Ishikawaella capsulata Mpkobe]
MNHRNIARKQFIKRFHVVCGGIVATVFSLVLRVTCLQIIGFIKTSDTIQYISPRSNNTRGMIFDRFNNPISVSIPVQDIGLDLRKLSYPGEIKNNKRWQALAEVLEIPLDKLCALISTHISNHPQIHFMYIARQIRNPIADYIKKLKLPGICFNNGTRRYYPIGADTANLIGLTDIDGKGISGIEQSFNSLLSGNLCNRISQKNKMIKSCGTTRPQNITLSIDNRLQKIAYRALDDIVHLNKADSGCVVIIDVNTGEILSMANSPSYNPNNVTHTPQMLMRNYAITDIFEPGSTIKPLVLMLALQLKLVEENSVINTLPYFIGKYLIRDVGYYKQLNLTGILQKSSNVGVSRLALAMSIASLSDTYYKFGLFQNTHTGLIGEKTGSMSKKHWSDIERATFSFGYGFTVTPLQLAQIYAIIATHGLARPLSIIKVNRPVPGKQIFPANIVKNVLHMMESVALPGGVGIKAAVKGYRVAVKTGTVKKVGPNKHYINQYVAYTVGIAPVSNPRFALMVLINNPKVGEYYGGKVAAPVFSYIMTNVLRVMNVKPDALV